MELSKSTGGGGLVSATGLMAGFITGEESRSCPEHGEYVSQRILGRFSPCPVCVERRLEKETQARVDAVILAQSENRLRRAREAAMIPPRFADRRLSTFVAEIEDQKKALRLCVDYAANFAQMRKLGRSMIFIGNPGTGKTHLAAAIAHEILNQGYTALYTSVLRALRSVKDGFSSTGETESAVIRKLAVPDLLILDEAGITYETDTEVMILYEIVNQRYEENKPTLFTSNYALDELKVTLGSRVIDRLREGGGISVPFPWESQRGAV